MKVYIDDGIENVKMLMKAGRQDWAKRLMKKLELFAPPAEIEKKGGKKEKMSTSNALSYEQTNYNKEVEDQDDLEARVTVLETLLGSANVYTETQFAALDTSSWTTAKLVLIVDPSGAATVRVWNPYTETFG